MTVKSFPPGTPWYTKVKVLRTYKGKSQEEMAKDLGVSRRTIYTWENGLALPNAESREKVAHWANVPEKTIFKGAEIEKGGNIWRLS